MIEKTFKEVIADIKEGEVWESKIGKKVYLKGDKLFIDFNHEVTISGAMLPLNEALTLQKKQYTFEEAFKAFEEGKEIESLASEIKYRRFDKKVSLFAGGENKNFSGINNDNAIFSINEIRSKWYINN